MGKTVLYITLLFTVVFMLCALSACSSNLKGSYSKTHEDGTVFTYTFSGVDKVKIERFDPSGNLVLSRTGSYKITNDKISFYNMSDGLNKEFDVKVENGSIIIDGYEYKKK